MNRSILFLTLLILNIFSVPATCAVSETNLEKLRQAAQRGEVKAQFELASAYYIGNGVPQDYQEAMKWYRKVAEQGVASAQHNLGIAYSKGLGVPQDYLEAVKWYRKAAEQGDSYAQNNLGSLYREGLGVVQNVQEAAKWYEKSASQGYAVAQYNLGVAYSRGEGITRNEKQAVFWYRKAAEQGYIEAQTQLEDIYKARPFLKEQTLVEKTDKQPKTPRPSVPSPTLGKIHNPVTAEETSSPMPSPSKPPQQQSTMSQSTATPLPAVPRKPSTLALVLVYTKTEDKQRIDKLTTVLRDLGYEVDQVEKVKIKLSKPQWDIRYYYGEDLEAVKNLQSQVSQFMQEVDTVEAPPAKFKIKQLRELVGTQKIRKGRVEVWILNP